jgi:hypothetical protein
MRSATIETGPKINIYIWFGANTVQAPLTSDWFQAKKFKSNPGELQYACRGHLFEQLVIGICSHCLSPSCCQRLAEQLVTRLWIQQTYNLTTTRLL